MKASGLRTFLAAFAVAAFIAALGNTAGAKNRIIDVYSLGPVSISEMVENMKGAKVVFVGESHDNARHHEAQLEIIRSMKEAGMKVAVGLEMFRAADQARLDEWVAGRTPEPDFVTVFGENWQGGYWPIYRPIFSYAREVGIPMVGLNIERSVVSRVSKRGIGSVDPREVPGADGLSCDPSAKYRERVLQVISVHMKNTDFVRFCEAQMLWDASMAWNLVDFLERNPEYTVVVLAGGFHSWKHGIPERVRRIADLPMKVVILSDERNRFWFEVSYEDADYVWWTGA